MKKNIFIVVFTVALLSFVRASVQEKGIEFNANSWSYIVATAKVQNKLIFLDAYTSWCAPCKWIAKNIFTNDSVADYYNKTFINASFDMEKGEGKELAKKFQIEAYPTFLFIDSNEKVIYQESGVNYKKNFYSTFIQYGKNAEEQEKKIKSERNDNK